MKKLHTLTEPQKVIALVAPLPLVALVASVALLTTYIDFMSALFIVVALLFIGAISSGVSVAVVKDAQLSRVVRGMRYTQTAIRAERDELSDKLENALADLRDEVARVRTLSAQVMADAEQLDDVRAHNETLGNKCVNYQIQRNRAVNAVDELRNELESVESQLNDSHSRETELRTANRALVADLAWARELLARDGRDLVEHDEADAYAETAFTHSASTAFAIGTLDRAYVVNNETRYPLA